MWISKSTHGDENLEKVAMEGGKMKSILKKKWQRCEEVLFRKRSGLPLSGTDSQSDLLVTEEWSISAPNLLCVLW